MWHLFVYELYVLCAVKQCSLADREVEILSQGTGRALGETTAMILLYSFSLYSISPIVVHILFSEINFIYFL